MEKTQYHEKDMGTVAVGIKTVGHSSGAFSDHHPTLAQRWWMKTYHVTPVMEICPSATVDFCCVLFTLLSLFPPGEV